MSGRVRLADNTDDGGEYFPQNGESKLEFVHSGCAILDRVLGGGWPLTRIANIVGDFSTGKTLLAIEASANFARQFPKGKIYYRESEAAFEQSYAATLGMPIDRVEFIEPEDFLTVEDFYADLCKCVDECRDRGVPGMYFVDSLDALSDKAEQARKFDESSYNLTKPKQMGKLFKDCVAKIAEARLCLVIISQTRDKIGTMFPRKTRSGGNALDFYSSQVIWLSHIDDATREIDKIKRVTGIVVKAKCTKNKISIPLRQCQFTIRFGQGIDSLTSNIDWLKSVHRLDYVIDCTKEVYTNRVRKMSDDEYWEESERVDGEVNRIWHEIEDMFTEDARVKYR